MLFLSILRLTFATTALAISLKRNPLELRQTTGSPCATNCTVPLQLLASCATNPDPFCGCTDFLPVAQTCGDCLELTNTTLDVRVNADFIFEAILLCSCQLPSCGNIILTSRNCTVANNSSPNCTCPAIVNATDCYTCLENEGQSKAPSLLGKLQGDISRCKAYLSTNASGSATASATSPTSSPTIVSTSESVTLSASGWLAVVVVSISFIAGMF